MITRGCIRTVLRVAALACLTFPLLLRPITAAAFETDNFFLPLDAELADLAPVLEMAHTIALEEAVAEVNTRIEKALQIKDGARRSKRLQALHEPSALADAFVKRFGHPLFEDSVVSQSLGGTWARQTYPGRKCSYQNFWMNFAAHVPLDLRRWTALAQCPTFKAYGVHFGGDKIVHFHHVGVRYYRRYVALVKKGLSREAACARVIEHFRKGGVWSERALFGSIVTGVYSNGDMAANYAGFKFFLNLTERVNLKGAHREPLVERSGVFWRLSQRVRPGSAWFSAFISDHWNEALNPSRYDALVRPGIRCILRSRAKSIVQFYTRKDKRPDDPVYFADLARELSTYYGEPYGHSGKVETLMTIGNTCIPIVRADAGKGAAP